MDAIAMFNPMQHVLSAVYGYDVSLGLSVFATVCVLFAIVLYVFVTWLIFRVFTRAGLNGWLSLLNFIPVIGLVLCLIVLAFDVWPSDTPTSRG